MLFNNRNLRARTLAGALLAVLVLSAPMARAVEPAAPIDDAEGPQKVAAYAFCAVQVFAAITPIQAIGAVLTCSRLFMAEASHGGGE